MKSKIFISSTCFDLIDLRSELFSYLTQGGLSPVMSDEMDSEFHTFFDKNSIETCLINLRSSDTVIIVLSQRYGPLLDKAGFGAVSATHLEYLEAVKERKNIMMFVRDRLEADFNNYAKTSDVRGLSWIRDKDLQIFDLLKDHKKLANEDKNNWYWTFKDSVEIKRRLDVALKNNISEIRLNDLIKNGNLPFIVIEPDISFSSKKKTLNFSLQVDNLGSHPAIEPWLAVYQAKDYEEVIALEQEGISAHFFHDRLKSLKSGEILKGIEFDLGLEDTSGTYAIIIEVVYLNAMGDYIADITKIEIELGEDESKVKTITVDKTYTGKRYLGADYYKRFIKE